MIISASLIGFVVLMTGAPYLILRNSRRSWALIDLTSWALLVGAALMLRGLSVALPLSLAFAIFVVLKVATFLAFVAIAEPAAFTPTAAGLFAGALYLILVPHVLQWPVDGDEPYYLLVTESLVHDRDLDLRNQYAAIAQSKTRRPDLEPQMGDPTGPNGEQYSRTEPFFSVLLVPGYLLFGLAGAVATVAVFGGLLVRSTAKLLEEEGFTDRARVVATAFLACGPPVLFYATRLWPEVPAAFLLVESIRGIRQRRTIPFALCVLGLGLLKLRFLLIVVPLLVVYARRVRVRWHSIAIAAGAILIPAAVVFLITGGFFGVHQLWELKPAHPTRYVRGAFGLLLDAQTGILFQAPFFILAIFALLRWRDVPPSARVGLLASVIYLLLLFPRDEWHGGWSPPLRYLVVLIPVLAVAVASRLDRVPRSLVVAILIPTAAIAIHGLAFPWRLFHIASGESIAGEVLSGRFQSDFSRMLPSFIRPNIAAWICSGLMVIAVVASRAMLRSSGESPPTTRMVAHVHALGVTVPPLAALLLAIWFRGGLAPAGVVHFEDTHVRKRGGELYPYQHTVARFLYSGGWTIRPGDSLTFQYDGGPSRLRYVAHAPAGVLIDGKVVQLPRTPDGFGWTDLVIGRAREHVIQGLAGEVIVDRIEKR